MLRLSVLAAWILLVCSSCGPAIVGNWAYVRTYCDGVYNSSGDLSANTAIRLDVATFEGNTSIGTATFSNSSCQMASNFTITEGQNGAFSFSSYTDLACDPSGCSIAAFAGFTCNAQIPTANKLNSGSYTVSNGVLSITRGDPAVVTCTAGQTEVIEYREL